MRIDLDGRDWPAPEPPPGVTLRNPDPAAESTYVEMHALVQSFFAGHYDFTSRDLASWREHFEASAGQDPTQWWVADVDGTPAALLVGDESRAELGMGWVRTLGVVAPFRGRGLGRLLLRTAFAQAAARGRTSVGLGVDSENATGATRLYESVGMWPESVLRAWRGDVTP
jgi:mycothiol synthase